MSFPVDWKPERAIQAKVRDLQKKIIQKNDDEKKTKTKTEASQFKWVNWSNALCAGLQMATSAKVFDWWVLSRLMATLACGLMNGDFSLRFDEWRL